MQQNFASSIHYHRLELPLEPGITRSAAKAIARFGVKQDAALVKVVMFVPSAPSRKTDSVRIQHDLIRHLVGNKHLPGSPAVTVVEQPPFKEGTCAIDIFYLDNHDSNRITAGYYLYDSLPYVILQGFGCRQFWSSGYITPYERMKGKKVSAAHAAGLYSLTKLQRWIDYIGLSFDHVIRQWNYIGQILDRKPIAPHTAGHGAKAEPAAAEANAEAADLKQNYQEFNIMREAFYRLHKHDTFYPAATGIGCDFEGIIVDAVLFEPGDKHKPPMVKSPVQAEAFDYTQAVLVGKEAKTPPLFSRARLQTQMDVGAEGGFPLCCWVSGTASIAGEKTLYPTEPEKQLEHTVESIKQLVSTTRPLTTRARRIRLYIKPSVSKEMAQRLVEKLYTHYNQDLCQVVYADICRDDLWVEIEGEFTTP